MKQKLIPSPKNKHFFILKDFFRSMDFRQSLLSLNILETSHCATRNESNYYDFTYSLKITKLMFELIDKNKLTDELCSVCMLYDIFKKCNKKCIDELYSTGISKDIVDTTKTLYQYSNCERNQSEAFLSELTRSPIGVIVISIEYLQTMATLDVYEKDKYKKQLQEIQRCIAIFEKVNPPPIYKPVYSLLHHRLYADYTVLTLFLHALEKTERELPSLFT